ncbi:hypothetical protein H5410_031167 [Solanum commersonii]|uniref:Uncharacterized protein n=1 Tax=Solanum commersonii TaxID=4109 RepID=A0A9J5YID2_SOLCO|nr:hypothetical protein H5410_031167 [Solanum commersonii]
MYTLKKILCRHHCSRFEFKASKSVCDRDKEIQAEAISGLSYIIDPPNPAQTEQTLELCIETPSSSKDKRIGGPDYSDHHPSQKVYTSDAFPHTTPSGYAAAPAHRPRSEAAFTPHPAVQRSLGQDCRSQLHRTDTTR